MRLVPLLRRQLVERFAGRAHMRRQRNAEVAQILRALDADREHALFNLGGDRLAVRAGLEGEDVDGVFGRQRNVLVLLGDAHFRHREGDQNCDVLGGLVEETIFDTHLLRGDEQILRTHLNIVVLHEDKAAGRELGGRIIGARGRCRDTKKRGGEQSGLEHGVILDQRLSRLETCLTGACAAGAGEAAGRVTATNPPARADSTIAANAGSALAAINWSSWA